MVERVIDVIKLKAKSVREFAESIGVKQVTLNQQLMVTENLVWIPFFQF